MSQVCWWIPTQEVEEERSLLKPSLVKSARPSLKSKLKTKGMQFGARRTVALHELSPEFNSQYHQKKKKK
jgi:hypothetical protein